MKLLICRSEEEYGDLTQIPRGNLGSAACEYAIENLLRALVVEGHPKPLEAEAQIVVV